MPARFKNNATLALAFGAYSVLVLAFLNPFRWIEPSDEWTALFVTSGLISVFSLLFFQLLKSVRFPLPYLQPRLLFGFIFSPILAALLAFYWLGATSQLFLFISSFIFLSVPPVAASILFSVFDELKHKIHIIGSKENTELEEVPSLKLTNDQGKVFLEVPLDRVLCFEANDNYVITHYLSTDNETLKSMDRISLKKIVETVETLPVAFERVHKSFLINPKFVREIKGRSQAYKILLNHHEDEIPVSRNFDISIFQR